MKKYFNYHLLQKLLVFFHNPIITLFDQKALAKYGQGFTHNGNVYIHHSELPPHETSFYTFSLLQKVVILTFLVILLGGLLVAWHQVIVLLVAVMIVLYFVDLLFNLFLITRSFMKEPTIRITNKEVSTLKNSQLPTYTVFCPLYKEWQVVPQFVKAMKRLDYPKNKLQIMLLLEDDDIETIKKIKKIRLPKNFRIISIPNSKPKTKPKALNYGLTKTTGEYCVVYDAEDIPDENQLKKAVVGFRKSDDKTVCMQAKLNFYNPHQNILTRIFTAEYSLWFELILTGLQSIGAPIPLGGTSNHFRTKDLRKLHGWDSFNVTEDCDLGIRLAKKGYKTAVINSVTLEEANSNLVNWFCQRTRWLKGYMQTYILHMRHPQEFITGKGRMDLYTFQLIVGGKVMSMFINPMMWLITISYFLFRAHIGNFIESFFPAPILYMGAFSLIFGNFLYVYYYMLGSAKHGHHALVKYVFFMPLYWLAMSISVWMATIELLNRPHYWSKTKHGLHLQQ